MRFLVLFLLVGCASEAELAKSAGTWAPDYEPAFLFVEDAHITCLSLGARFKEGQVIGGCADAWGRISKSRCTVILPKNPPTWLIEHELLHCKYGSFHN
jgi:hypothetical protein